MKIRLVISSNTVFKLISEAVIVLTLSLSIDNIATASTFSMKENNGYDLEKLSDFSLKFNPDLYNSLEEEIFRQNYGLSEYIDLIDSESNENKYDFQVRLNILTQSQTNIAEENLLASFLSSLRQLEFDSLRANSSSPAKIPILPQVSYRNIYKDLYDFDIDLANSSQIRTISRRVPRTTIRTQPLADNKYFYSYFQGRKKSNYSSLDNQSLSIKSPKSSLLFSSQKNSSLDSIASVANLTNPPLVDLSSVTNKNPFSVLPTNITDTDTDTNINLININKPDDESLDNDNSQLLNGVQAVYLPSTKIEIYQFNNFNVPSALSSYQKPDYQEELDERIEKQNKKMEKQRKKLSKQLAKMQRKREEIRKKEQEKYRKKREQELTKMISQQRKLQQQRQAQLR